MISHNSTFSEASKIVMRYVAAVSGHGDKVDQIKEQLLQSNPVLEGKFLCFFMIVLGLFSDADLEVRQSNTDI